MRARNLFAIISMVLSTPAFAQVDLKKGGAALDRTSFNLRYSIQSAKPENLEVIADPAGSSRIVMRAKVAKDDAKVYGGLRTEVIPRDEYIKQGIRWYTFSFYLPATWQSDIQPMILAQLHTSQKTVVLSPPVAWVLRGNKLELDFRANHRSVSGTTDLASMSNSVAQTITLARVEKAKWYCFVVKADWATTPGNGSFNLWMNGEPVYTSDKLYNSYETWLGNYPKIGIYAPGGMTVPSQSVYMDFIHLGGPESTISQMRALTPCK